MKVTSRLLMALFCLSSTIAAAQSRELDMKTSISLGLENSAEMKQAESKRREVRAQSWTLRSELFPEISARATSERRMNSSAIRQTNVLPGVNTSSEPFRSYLAAIDLQQPIFAGWSLISGWKLSTSLKDTAEKEYYASQQAVTKALVNAFYDYAAANDYYRAAQTNLQTLQTYSGSMARYAKIGRGREMDRLQASVNASLSEVDAESALQKQQEAELHLKTLLNIPVAEKVTAKFNFEVQALDPITVDQAVELALKNNPTLVLLQQTIRQTELRNDIAIATERPSLAFLASYGTQALDRDDMFHREAEFYSYGLSLTIPLFSGFSSLSKKREFREQVFQTERTFEIEKRNLRERIRNSLANVGRLYKQYQDLQKVTKSSQRALDLVNGGFRQGTTTPQDVVNFQTSRYQAERVLIEIQFAYLKSVAELRELLGVDLIRVYGEQGAGQS